MNMCTSLKVTRHLRGHVASCNGSTEVVQAWVEQFDGRELSNSAFYRAAEVQRLTQLAQKKKQADLIKFHKEVKRRIRRQAKRNEAMSSSSVTTAERAGAERAGEVPIGLNSLPVGHSEDEAVQVEGPAFIHEARKALLARRVTWGGDKEKPKNEMAGPRSDSNGRTFARQCHGESRLAMSAHPRRKPYPAEQLVLAPSEGCVVASSVPTRDTSSLEGLREAGEEPDSKYGAPSCVMLAPGKHEYTQRKEAQRQCWVSRRLWSQLEREQVRHLRSQQTQAQEAEVIKSEREALRRIQEVSDTASIDSSEAGVSREIVKQWATLLVSEEQKHKLMKAKENKRFISALKEKVKQRIVQKHSQLPALCSCARTFLETDPNTCANNCMFYKNEKAYTEALWSLFSSLEAQ